MGHSYVWRGGSDVLAAATAWTDATLGALARVAPGRADSASLSGAAAGLILATGALDVGALALAGGVALDGAVRAGTLVESGTLGLTGAAVLAAGQATLGGALAVGAGTRAAVAGTLSLAGVATARGGGRITAGALRLAGGTLEVDAGSAAAIGAAAAAGTLLVAGRVAGFGALAVGAGAVIVDSGTIAAEGGALTLFGGVVGAGTLAIGAAATLFAAGPVAAGLTVAFTGAAGTLELFGIAAGFAATVTGFAVGDAIAISASSVGTAIWAAGVLTLTADTGATLALALPDGGGQSYDGATFLALPDRFGGTEIRLAPAAVAAPGSGRVTLAAGTATFYAGAPGHAAQLVVGGLLVVGTRFTASTLALAGTIAAVNGAVFSTPVATQTAGLLTAIGAGAGAIVRTTLLLSGTLAAAGGGGVTVGTLALAGGTVTLDAVSTMQLGAAAAAETGTIALAAGATLAGFGRIAAPIDVAGTLLVQGGALLLAAAAGGAGGIGIGAGATLAVLAPVALPIGFGAGATLTLLGPPALVGGTLIGFAAGDVIDVASTRIDAAAWAGGTLTLSAAGVAIGTLHMAGRLGGRAWRVADDGAGGTLVSLGSGGGAPLVVTGTLAVADRIAAPSATAEAGALLAMQGGTLAVGALSLAAGAQLAGAGTVTASIANAGTLAATGGALAVSGPITGAGRVLIGSGGTLFAEAGFGVGTTVAFVGSGALELFASAAGAPGLVTGFGAGDAIAIAGAAVMSAAWTARAGGLGVLDLTGAAGDLGALTLAGDFAHAAFLATPDGAGGSTITLVPCFAAGTLIATPDGEVPVQALRPGDRVLTPHGPRRLRWVAARRCDGRAAPEARPVRIAAGALARLLGAALPRRDLLLSPQHALALGRVLVPAVALVDGCAIARAPPGIVAYHHLGLDRHATVLAEGVACETFLPLGDRAAFDRECGDRPAPGLPCAPRLVAGPALAALRRRLLSRPPPLAPPGALLGHVERRTGSGAGTRLEGWALDRANPARPVALVIHRDARPVAVAPANLWRPDLDRAGLGACGFDLRLRLPAAGLSLRRAGDGARLPFA